MSKQSSDLPDEPEVAPGKSGKKRHGDWEVWRKHNTKLARWLMSKWHKHRSYPTREIAETALKKFRRDFPASLVKYELRFKGEKVE